MKKLNKKYLCHDCGKTFKYYDMDSDELECLYCESKNVEKITNNVKNIKTIEINAKCSDLCFTTFRAENEIIAEIDSYPPEFLGDGDSINLIIDIETGRILNWKKPSKSELQEFIGSNEDNEY